MYIDGGRWPGSPLRNGRAILLLFYGYLSFYAVGGNFQNRIYITPSCVQKQRYCKR